MMAMADTTKNARTCAGCGKRDQAEALVRVVIDPSSSELAVDMAGSAFGRGAHVHAAPSCLKKALKGGFQRAFKTPVEASAQTLGSEIVAAAERRIEGLLGGARRGRLVAVGADAVVDALKEGKAEVLVVACDAAKGSADLPLVRKAVGDGKAVVFADKSRLGAIFSRDEVALVAVLHAGVARAIRHAELTSAPFRSEAWWSPEVR
jgi:predicted RNA-binding protein YlxR (DUF448 family)